jgi:hypothetical protein
VNGGLVAMVCGAAALTIAVPALASQLTNEESSSGALVSGATSLVSETPRLNDAVEADEEGNDGSGETRDAGEHAPRHGFDRFDQRGKAGRKSHDSGNVDQDREGHGPPAWAQVEKHKSHVSLATWKTLTPGQRRGRMAALARKHAVGMRRWGECTSAGREGCVRPVPPGLVKRG